jgi:hypothetical protein
VRGRAIGIENDDDERERRMPRVLSGCSANGSMLPHRSFEVLERHRPGICEQRVPWEFPRPGEPRTIESGNEPRNGAATRLPS